MSVKTIFKILLGTIVIMVASSLFIELFNVNVSGMQVKQMTRMAAKQACVLFTQETYKTSTGSSSGTNTTSNSLNSGGAVKVSNVLTCDGTTYISGNFYGTTNAQQIWNKIYTSTNFKNFCSTYADGGMLDTSNTEAYDTKHKYRALRLLNVAAQSGGNVSIPSVSWDSSASDIQANIDASEAQLYYDSMYTTANLGIPYLDEEITNKMFKWNLAQLLSNCDSDLIQKDPEDSSNSNKYYVNYKGFRCYVQDAEITSYTYKVYNLSVASDVRAFKQDTGMSPNQILSVSGESKGSRDYSSLIQTDLKGNEIYDNVLVTVVGINYQVPMTYAGITPLKKIFQFAWKKEVAGRNGTESERNVGWDSVARNMEGGGLTGNTSGILPVSGKLVYMLER
jgi:hypothetical protein